MSTNHGTSGDDVLSGSGGDVQMIGGAGNDVYVVDSLGDSVVELAPAMTMQLVSAARLTGAAAGGDTLDLSADGRFIAYQGSSRNHGLTPSFTSTTDEVLVKDLLTGALVRASSSQDGTPAELAWNPTISSDGSLVVFDSPSASVTGIPDRQHDIVLKNLTTGAVINLTGAEIAPTPSATPYLSDDGRFVAFVSSRVMLDGEIFSGVFRKDLATGEVTSVLNIDLAQLYGLSRDGNIVLVDTEAGNVVPGDTNFVDDLFVRTMSSGSIVRVNTTTDGVEANARSSQAALSADGRFVVFSSMATNLVPGDTNNAIDIFVKNLNTGELTRVSVAEDGTQGNFHSARTGSQPVAISGDGRFVVFSSAASNLVPGDTNGVDDVFVRDMSTGQIARVSIPLAGGWANGPSGEVDISDDGSVIAFSTRANNLTAGDTNSGLDIYAVGNPLLNGGTDTVRASVNFTLPDHVENLTLEGAGLRGVGNALDNLFVNDGSSNIIDGGAGRDVLRINTSSSAYEIAKLGSQFRLAAQDGSGDSVTLSNVEAVQFNDKTFELTAPARTQAPQFGLDASFLFDPVFYVLDNYDLVPTLTLATASQHYFNESAGANGARPNSWFDPDYYENRWDDLKTLNLDPVTLFQHYNLFGVWEGRSAGPLFDQFDGNRYLQDNPDVAGYVDANLPAFLGSRTNGAIAHYVIYGSAEGRAAFDFIGQAVRPDYAIDIGA